MLPTYDQLHPRSEQPRNGVSVGGTSSDLQGWQADWPLLPLRAVILITPAMLFLANLLVSPLFSCPKLLSRTSAQATSGQCTAG